MKKRDVVLAKIYFCPECMYHSTDPEEVGAHIERHREVEPPRFSKRGRPRTIECPQGCGRHFRKTNRNSFPMELAEHLTLCDGSKPIPCPSKEKVGDEKYAQVST